MKRIDYSISAETEVKKIDKFIEKIISVCKKYNLSIGHEDSHGAFMIGDYDESDAEWLREACIWSYSGKRDWTEE